MDEWRLIETPLQNGFTNMAIDEALLLSTVKNHTPPVLRLYGWDPACLSLGFAQSVSDIDMEALSRRGWDYVRRPTGGKAILHIDELTYSICAPIDSPAVSGSVLESYRRLSMGLLAALGILGLQANADKEYGTSSAGENRPVCFEVPSNYEITSAGKKLIGSAQSRKSGGVLQHGALPLSGDITRINEILSYPDDASREAARQRIYLHAATLEEVLGRTVSWAEAASAYTSGFEKSLGIKFVKSSLSQEEQALAIQLLHSKYETREWNEK
jgi:lipoate-protein ligase A